MRPPLIKFYQVRKAPNGRERFIFLIAEDTPSQGTYEFEQWLDANVGTNWFYMNRDACGVFESLPEFNDVGLVVLDQDKATLFLMSKHCSGTYSPPTVA